MVLIQQIPLIGGTTAGLQTVSGILAKVSGDLAQLQIIIAPYQQVLLGDQMIKQVTVLAMRSIQQYHLSDWGDMP